MIFVTVGASLPFDRLIEYIDTEFAPNIKEKVVAQIHDSAKYKPKNIEYFSTMDRTEYINYLKKADIIITHAGMGVILDCIKYNKNFILVPRNPNLGEIIDGHQYEICDYLKENYDFNHIVYDNLMRINDFVNDNQKYNMHIDNNKNLSNFKKNLIENLTQYMQKNKKIFIVCSSGGHLNQMLYIIDIFPKDKVLLITNSTKSNISNYKMYSIRGDFTDKFLGIRALIIAPYLFFKYRPSLVFTNGGGEVAVPFSFFGKIFGSKIVFMETISRVNSKSSAAKYTYPIADKFIIQWEKNLKNYGKKAEYWGSIL